MVTYLLVTYNWADNNDNDQNMRKLIRYDNLTQDQFLADSNSYVQDAIAGVLGVSDVNSLPVIPYYNVENGEITWLKNPDYEENGFPQWVEAEDRHGYPRGGLIEYRKYEWTDFKVQFLPRAGTFAVHDMSADDQGDLCNATTKDYHGANRTAITVECTLQVPENVLALGPHAVKAWIQKDLEEATYELPFNLAIYVG